MVELFSIRFVQSRLHVPRKQETKEQERISNLSRLYRSQVVLRKFPIFSHPVFIKSCFSQERKRERGGRQGGGKEGGREGGRQRERESCCVTDDYLRCKVQYPPHYDGVTSEGSRSRDSVLDNVTDNRWRFEPRGSYHDDMGAISSTWCRRLYECMIQRRI